MALREVIRELRSPTSVQVTLKAVTGPMLSAISSFAEAHDAVAADCLDVVSEELARYGHLLTADHARILQTLLSTLGAQRAGVRKRAIAGLGSLGPHLDDALLSTAVQAILAKLQPGVQGEVARTYVQTCGALARATGYRFGPFLPATWPSIVALCRGAEEEDFELREYCLQALEVFVDRCALAMVPALGDVLKISLEFLSYDPNYAADEDEAMASEGEGEGDEAMDEDDEGDYSDDEDMSWKVRRASTKCLATTYRALPDQIDTIYCAAAARLVHRFSEREESVRVDVFQTFRDLVRVCAASPAALAALQADTPRVMKALTRALRAKTAKTQKAAAETIGAMVGVLPGCLRGVEAPVLAGLSAILMDKSAQSSANKLEALAVLKVALSKVESGALLRAHTASMVEPLCACVQDKYYKVAAEGLRVTEQLAKVVLAEGTADAAVHALLSVGLLAAIDAKLSQQDQDQEVKESALACAAVLAALSPAGALGPRLQAILTAVMERIKNESTRLAAVRALESFLASPRSDPAAVLPVQEALLELTGFLRKANRPLRQAALRCLESLATKVPESKMGASNLTLTVKEAGALVQEPDLPIAALAISLLATLTARAPSVAQAVADDALGPATHVLLTGAVGTTLPILTTLLAELVKAGVVPAVGLVRDLLVRASEPDVPKTAANNAAHAIAVAVCAAGQAVVSAQLAFLLQSSKDGAGVARVALLALGEIGRGVDFSQSKEGQEVLDAINGRLKATGEEGAGEELKLAASCALGALACGNLPHFLPMVLGSISSSANAKDSQYLMVYALREMIVHVNQSGNALTITPAQEEQIVQMIVRSCEAEEGTRSLAAECLGGLGATLGQRLVGRMQDLVKSPSPAARACVLSGARHMLPDRRLDGPMTELLPTLLPLIGEEDIGIAKAAVQLLSAAVHNKPSVALPLLSSQPALISGLYAHATKKEHLIKTINMGPFKVLSDEGLDSRKAAYECLAGLLDACPDRLNAAQFLTHLAQHGLRDHYDVKVPAFGLLDRATQCYPAHIGPLLEAICAAIEETLNAKLRAEAVKQEVDRHEETLHVALRSVKRLSALCSAEGFQGNPAVLQALVERCVLANEDMRKRFESISATEA